MKAGMKGQSKRTSRLPWIAPSRIIGVARYVFACVHTFFSTLRTWLSLLRPRMGHKTWILKYFCSSKAHLSNQLWLISNVTLISIGNRHTNHERFRDFAPHAIDTCFVWSLASNHDAEKGVTWFKNAPPISSSVLLFVTCVPAYQTFIRFGLGDKWRLINALTRCTHT